MKNLIATLILPCLIPAALTGCGKTTVAAEAPADAAATFLAAYRKALDAKDTAALDAFLLTDGTPAEVVEFFKMMREVPAGGKTTVELKTPTAEEAAKFNQAMEMPDGKYYKLPITPSHQLVVTTATKEGESTNSSTSSFPVAMKDGKFVIPLPVPTTQAAH